MGFDGSARKLELRCLPVPGLGFTHPELNGLDGARVSLCLGLFGGGFGGLSFFASDIDAGGEIPPGGGGSFLAALDLGDTSLSLALGTGSIL